MQTADLDPLRTLAETLADWIEPAPGVPAIYLFGSRVRGDHRPDSDVDVRLLLKEWDCCDATCRWWEQQNETDFAAVKARLPGERGWARAALTAVLAFVIWWGFLVGHIMNDIMGFGS